MLSTRSNNMNTTAHSASDIDNNKNNNTQNSNHVVTIQLANPQQPIHSSVPNVQNVPNVQTVEQVNHNVSNAKTNSITATKESSQNNTSDDPEKESSTTVVADLFHKSEMDIFNNPDNDNARIKSDDYILKHINFKLSDGGDTQHFIKDVKVNKPTEKKNYCQINWW